MGKKMGAFHISVPHMRKHFTSAVRLWREKMKHSTLLSDSPINCDTFPELQVHFDYWRNWMSKGKTLITWKLPFLSYPSMSVFLY